MSKQFNYQECIRESVRQSLLYDWDPIGIADFPEASDEYDSYVNDICALLESSAAEADLLNYLHWLEVEHIGLPGANWRRCHFARRLLKLKEECLKKCEGL